MSEREEGGAGEKTGNETEKRGGVMNSEGLQVSGKWLL